MNPDPSSADTDGEPVYLTEAWRREVARRSDEYDAGIAESVTWQEVKSRWAARGSTA